MKGVSDIGCSFVDTEFPSPWSGIIEEWFHKTSASYHQIRDRVKDCWRVVNHRDIIPTVPRLMGYCHVAQPVYLAAGGQKNSLENVKLSGDGYQGDVIGEATPDVLVSEFMKGEKELVNRILQTEINIFRAIRDGSALMQHMEDFYYISLLENVKSNYRTATVPLNRKGGDLSVS